MSWIVHIETSAGARFSMHENDEEMRNSLIQYYNEVHAQNGMEAEEFKDTAPLEVVVEAIEEHENVSREEVEDFIQLQPKELDTVLAALRYWQRYGRGSNTPEWDIASNGREGDDAILSDEGIDELCERINC